MSHLSFQTNLGPEPPINLTFTPTFPTLAGWCQYAASLSDPTAALNELLLFLQHPSFNIQRRTHPVKVCAIAVQGPPITPLLVVGDTHPIKIPELHEFQTQILIQQHDQPPTWLHDKHAKGITICQEPDTPPIVLPQWLTPTLRVFEQSRTLPFFSADTSFFPLDMPLSDSQLQRASGGTPVFRTELTPLSEHPQLIFSPSILYETGTASHPFLLMLGLEASAGHRQSSTTTQTFKLYFTGRAGTLAEISTLMETAIQRFVLCYQQYVHLQLWLTRYQQELVFSEHDMWYLANTSFKCMWSMERTCSIANTDTMEIATAVGIAHEDYSQSFSPVQMTPILQLMLPRVLQAQQLALAC